MAKKLALIGVGMIGGSAALAWRAAGQVTHVTGYDLDSAALGRARELGVIDAAAADIAGAVASADIVLLAVPVGAMRAVFEALAPCLPTYAVVTDVGSTKSDVISAARAALNANSSFSFRRFVPAHPIAGRERPGVEAADPNLFRGRFVITTPAADTHPDALAAVEALWAAAGARVERMDAPEHDRIFAAVSHLPHLLAYALVAQIAGQPDGERKLGFAGGGFRDFTRIAASSPVMWRDIALANRVALGEQLRGYRAQLDALQAAVDAGDAAALQKVFELASRTRRRFAGASDAE
jgi:prephenate dehydrogenase